MNDSPSDLASNSAPLVFKSLEASIPAWAALGTESLEKVAAAAAAVACAVSAASLASFTALATPPHAWAADTPKEAADWAPLKTLK